MDTVVKTVPGLPQAVFLLAKVKYQSGERLILNASCFVFYKLIFSYIPSLLFQVTLTPLRAVFNIVWTSVLHMQMPIC